MISFYNSLFNTLSKIYSIPLADCDSRSAASCISLQAHVAKQSPLETGDCFDGRTTSRNDIIFIVHL